MNIEDILNQPVDDAIKLLKLRVTKEPVAKTLKDQYEVSGHEINSKEKRPDKLVKYTYEEGGIQKDGLRVEYVARIALSLQKLIVERAVAFLFGNNVKLNCNVTNKAEQTTLDVINRIHKDNKIDSFNRRIARAVMSEQEAAEYWYVTDSTSSTYTTKSKKKLRVAMFSPFLGDTLYPLFDEYGDLIAFSRSFTVEEGSVTIEYFETYTDKKIIRWQQTQSGWIEVSNLTNEIGKIPIIYGRQDSVEWSDVQSMIDRLEKLLSNLADTNDYHASPTIKAKGEITGFYSKGEQGKILQLGENADASYMSWDKAPESVKLEIDTLLKMIYNLTQTPDIAFDNLQGNDNISGRALKLMFIDAHLKVQNKQEIFDQYLQRRLSVINAFVKSIDNTLVDVTIDPVITPYMIGDERETIDMLQVANGGKPVISQKTSIALSGLIEDAQKEMSEIEKEEQTTLTRSFQEPTV